MKKLKQNIVPIILSLAAFVLCIIMSVHALSGEYMPGCSAGSSCDTVLASRWSVLFGFLPVSIIATGLYLAVLVCLAYLTFSSDDELCRLCRIAMCAFAGAIIGSAVWFSVIQLFLLHALCKYCLTVHLTGVLLSLVILSKFASPELKSRRTLAFSAGLVAAGLLSVAQIFLSPDNYYDRGYAEGDLPAASRLDLPVLGNPDAEHTVVLLFDYQCPHCRTLHSVLEEVADSFDGRLRFVLCPSPLSPECNPYVPASDRDLFKGSCTLAKLALALWHTDRDAYKEFDRWLFSAEGGEWQSRTEEEALEMAEAFVDREELRGCMSSAWMVETMSQIYDIFGRTSSDGKGGLPRLICGQKWIVPEVTDAKGIENIIREAFDLENGN